MCLIYPRNSRRSTRNSSWHWFVFRCATTSYSFSFDPGICSGDGTRVDRGMSKSSVPQSTRVRSLNGGKTVERIELRRSRETGERCYGRWLEPSCNASRTRRRTPGLSLALLREQKETSHVRPRPRARRCVAIMVSTSCSDDSVFSHHRKSRARTSLSTFLGCLKANS